MPQLPNDTRWNSQVACVEKYVENYSIYMEINGTHHNEIQDNIGKIIDNVGIYRNAQNLLTQLKIVGSALNQVGAYSLEVLKFEYYYLVKTIIIII